MLELTNAQIGGWIASFVLPLFRVAALLMTMPVIGTQLVSVRVRLYLALGVCVVLVPNLPSMPQVDALSMKAMLLIGEQILVGALLGFSLQLLFHAFVIAGQIISMQMGLGFASMVDPANGVSVPVLGQFFTMLVTLLFLAMNGHLVVFEVIAESFVTLPVGEGLSGNHFWIIAGKLGWGDGRGTAAGAAGDHRAAGGEPRLRRHDPRGAATEHLLHRLSVDPGAGPGDPLDRHRRPAQPVPGAGRRGPAIPP